MNCFIVSKKLVFCKLIFILYLNGIPTLFYKNSNQLQWVSLNSYLYFFFFFFISISFNKASAATIKNSNVEGTTTSTKSKSVEIKNKKAPFIQMIWIYTTCPNGVRRAIGCIGLTDNGTFIDYIFWGETIACENDQVAIWA